MSQFWYNYKTTSHSSVYLLTTLYCNFSVLILMRSSTSYAWICAYFVLTLSGFAKFCFTDDVCRISCFKDFYQCTSGNLKQGLTNLPTLNYLSLIYLSHGYWQLTSTKCSQKCYVFNYSKEMDLWMRLVYWTKMYMMHTQSTIVVLVPDWIHINIV